MAKIELSEVTKVYREVVAVNRLNMRVEDATPLHWEIASH